MRNLVRYIIIIALISIVAFVNFYNVDNKSVWNLIYYTHYYLIVTIFLKWGWTYFKDILTRSLLVALGFYYAFEMTIDIIDIIDHALKIAIYKGKYINYILALSCGCSLLILPILDKVKKWLKK